jgi:hypothetical protein
VVYFKGSRNILRIPVAPNFPWSETREGMALPNGLALICLARVCRRFEIGFGVLKMPILRSCSCAYITASAVID